VSRLMIRGVGVVSPAGWGLESFRHALSTSLKIPTSQLRRPGSENLMFGRSVPTPDSRPAFLSHPRLRRSSPISHFATFATMESLGSDLELVLNGTLKLGLILCVTSGCVTYTRRFYDEVIKAPSTASPLLFPETVFNAPASHIAAVLGSSAPAYTLIGDQGTFLNALALAADWLERDYVDGCVVVGAEELDWLRAYAIQLLDKRLSVSEGAGAVYLSSAKREGAKSEIRVITDPQLYTNRQTRLQAIRNARSQLGPATQGTVLCDGLQGSARTDRHEAEVWLDWPGPRVSPKRILGEALMASAAWQCVAAADLVQREHPAAIVSIAGCNQQAIASLFGRIA
jgi:hypothetical protein